MRVALSPWGQPAALSNSPWYSNVSASLCVWGWIYRSGGGSLQNALLKRLGKSQPAAFLGHIPSSPFLHPQSPPIPLQHVEGLVDGGRHRDLGGLGRPIGLDRGYYVRPTVFSNVHSGMTIEQEEIFGPVVVVVSYESQEEAIRIANGTPYGLGAYVFAGDLRKGYEVGSQLRAGRVFLNGVPSNTAAPMGGYRHSGNGREMGRFGLEEYLEVKAMFGFPEPLGF